MATLAELAMAPNVAGTVPQGPVPLNPYGTPYTKPATPGGPMRNERAYFDSLDEAGRKWWTENKMGNFYDVAAYRNTPEFFNSLSAADRQKWTDNKMGAYYKGLLSGDIAYGTMAPGGVDWNPEVRTTAGNAAGNWAPPTGELTPEQFDALARSLTGGNGGGDWERLTPNMTPEQRNQLANKYGPGGTNWGDVLKWYESGGNTRNNTGGMTGGAPPPVTGTAPVAPPPTTGTTPPPVTGGPKITPAPTQTMLNTEIPAYVTPEAPDNSSKPFDLYNDEGYQFRKKEGIDGIQNSAAAGGSLLSGNTLKELARFNSGLAADEYAAAYGRSDNENKTNRRNYEDSRNFGRSIYNSDRDFGFTVGKDARDFDFAVGRDSRDYQTELDKWNKTFGYTTASGDRAFNADTLKALAAMGLNATNSSGNLAAILANLLGQNGLTGAGAGANATVGGANNTNAFLSQLLAMLSRNSATTNAGGG